MAVRAFEQAQNLVTQFYGVPAAKSVTKGLPVIFSGSDEQIENAPPDSDLAIGIARESAGPLGRAEVALFAYAVVKAKAGTGGVTRGSKVVIVADGWTNAPADNGGATTKPTYGFALQTALVNEEFSLALSGPANRTTT